MTAQDQQSCAYQVPGTAAGFMGAYASEHRGATPTPQEVWDAARLSLVTQQAARALPAGMEPVATIASIDEHGPCFGWHRHWVNFPVGTNFYTAAQVQAMLAQGLAPGWQAVPVESTPEMKAAGRRALKGAAGCSSAGQAVMVFDAMLAAALRPPAAQERKPLTDERIREIDDETHFHESPDWPVRFARAIETELKKAPAP